MLTPKEVVAIYDDIMNCKDGKLARKSLDFLDGLQIPHMVQRLNQRQSGRQNWKERGFIPMFRNLTKSVVERSGLLYTKGMPTISLVDVVTEEQIDDLTTLYNDYLDNAEFDEFCMNLDDTVRLLKTVYVLTEYDVQSDSYYFCILHEGNSEVEYVKGTNQIDYVAYLTGDDETSFSLRIIDNEFYTDWTIKSITQSSTSSMTAELVSKVDNPYGTVPVSIYHDVKSPRTGRENEIDPDLISLNEELNMFMSDIGFASSWSMRKTLFTNASFGDSSALEVATPDSESSTYPSKLTNVTTQTNRVIAGPDQAVIMDTRGIDSPFIEYKGPDFNIQQLLDLWKFMIQGIAHDWSVAINFDGMGTANSGFQLVVQEIPNMELRQKRQRMAECGLKRLVETMIMVHDKIYGQTTMVVPVVEFPEYHLPMDPESLDKLWFGRIDKGVATKEDYLVNVLGYTPTEAQQFLQDQNNQISNNNQPIGVIDDVGQQPTNYQQ